MTALDSTPEPARDCAGSNSGGGGTPAYLEDPLPRIFDPELATLEEFEAHIFEVHDAGDGQGRMYD